MIRTWETVKHGDKVWACSYNYDRNRTEKRTVCKPVYGEIRKDGYCKYFVPYKKDGTLRTSGKVHAYSRDYADSEKECVDLYNQKIQDRIDFLKKEIDNLEIEKLKK